MIKVFAFLGLLGLGVHSNAQLANGSTAPDFTLEDYYGGTHNLYSYLNAGKTVFIEIFAAHCPTCWSYHQSNTLKDLYNTYGPNGTDEVMVLALEYDEYNDSTAFTGNHSPWVTAGDWLTGTPYPIFNVEGGDRQVFSDYNVGYYPMVYKICPDKLTELVSTSLDYNQLYQKAQACPPLSIDEQEEFGKVYFNNHSSELTVEKFENINQLDIYSLQGKLVQQESSLSNGTLELSHLTPGLYIAYIQSGHGTMSLKFVVN